MRPAKQQAGIVLVFTLVMLATLSVIVLNSMRSSVLSEKMSGNYRDSERAHQAAESALRQAAQLIDNMSDGQQLTNHNGLLMQGNDPDRLEPDYLDQSIWQNANNYSVASPLGDTTLSAAPKFIIKHLGKQKICNPNKPFDTDSNAENTAQCYREIFRITAHGTGQSNNTVKILQAFYEREVF